MFYSNNEIPQSAGFSIHGAYWHNNFGHPMSHGCVNMKTTDAKKLFEWVDDPSVKETIVTVYGKAQI
jgi:lipoprotein-anchoring transpeptidase ErfK/SrfK